MTFQTALGTVLLTLTGSQTERPDVEEIKIRKANQEDAGAITTLLEQLGYPGTQVFLADRINLLADDSSEELVVGEL